MLEIRTVYLQNVTMFTLFYIHGKRKEFSKNGVDLLSNWSLLLASLQAFKYNCMNNTLSFLCAKRNALSLALSASLCCTLVILVITRALYVYTNIL